MGRSSPNHRLCLSGASRSHFPHNHSMHDILYDFFPVSTAKHMRTPGNVCHVET